MPLEFIADENIHFQIIKTLREAGFGVYSITEKASGITDKEVIETAVNKNSIILTEDSDFGENKGVRFIYSLTRCLRYADAGNKLIGYVIIGLLDFALIFFK